MLAPKVAAVFTIFEHRSHAHVLLENFLEPYLFNGKVVYPGVTIASFYADQFPEEDMARDIAKKYGIPLYKTIEEALCLGGKELAVDGVLSIGEHGDYPVNKLDQREYPRKRFFDEIIKVMRRSGRSVPLFNDKHLSFRWDWAKEMYDTARKLKIPFLAGSSVPLAQRKPPLEIPAGSRIAEAISIHGGGVESYDFHALEVLQSMVESRRGGESGIRRVEFLDEKSIWKAGREGRWSLPLAEAAMRAELGDRFTALDQFQQEPPHAILVEYKDGLKAATLKIGKSSGRWNFACRLKDEAKPRATHFYNGPWRNRNLFKALAYSIQRLIIDGEAPYPIERTLLTTGALEAAMRSRRDAKPIDTPHLEFTYKAKDYRAMREMGASWKIITEKTPPPKGVNPGTPRRLLKSY